MSGAVDATREEITALGAEDIAPGLAAIAITLATALDADPSSPATPSLARELRATLLELRKMSPPKAEGDALDDLAARRAQRLGA
ncbi:hypothetical protein OHA91_22820 [Streptomyces erythrochromogenes]|uniref:Uncharacterized protein n=1 Tax=Streptomyces erythrochromogenes TaxID=285574 RepID=A0ABZ1QF80_9ACTN|nr:hypothetical protein [Streptomyces erythrochromogenes]